MKLKRLIAPLLVGVLAFAIAGCGNSTQTSETPKEIKIGATAGPHAQVAEAVAKEAQKQGINLKVVEFSDYVTPDKALADGDIQLNAYQHVPFMENFNKQNGSKLVAIGKTILMPMGLYSNSVHSAADVPEGAIVAIPNDPTNGGRGLALLAKAGLITLKDSSNILSTVQDITSNPNDYQFVELEAAQVPRSLDDVALAAINTNYALNADLTPGKDALAIESKDSPYVNIVTVLKGNESDPKIKKLMEALHSPEIKKFIEEKYKGAVVPAF